MSPRVLEISVCPHCGAKGVKIFNPIVIDTHPVDVPYCGACGKNYPDPNPPAPRSNVREFSR